MRTFSWREDLDRRVFAAVRFVNAVDRSPITGPMNVVTSLRSGLGPLDPKSFVPLRIHRNRQGLHVIHSGTTPFSTADAKALADYANTFDPPPSLPTVESLTARLRVTDPSGWFLPADFNLALPRSPVGRDPLHSVAAPHMVEMFPSPAAPTADGWAVLRVMAWRLIAAPTVANPNATRAVPLPGALVRVLRHKPNTTPDKLELLGRGPTEWRLRADGARASCAEALVALRNIPVTTWSTNTAGPVLSEVQPVRLEGRFDPAFNPDLPDAMPDLPALERGDPPLIRDTLVAPLDLRARARLNRHVAFDTKNHLTEFQPG